MECIGKVVPLVGGLSCPNQGSPSIIGPSQSLSSHLWLQAAVACAAATPRQTASTGGLNQVRVADGSQTLGERGACSPPMHLSAFHLFDNAWLLCIHVHGAICWHRDICWKTIPPNFAVASKVVHACVWNFCTQTAAGWMDGWMDCTNLSIMLFFLFQQRRPNAHCSHELIACMLLILVLFLIIVIYKMLLW